MLSLFNSMSRKRLVVAYLLVLITDPLKNSMAYAGEKIEAHLGSAGSSSSSSSSSSSPQPRAVTSQYAPATTILDRYDGENYFYSLTTNAATGNRSICGGMVLSGKSLQSCLSVPNTAVAFVYLASGTGDLVDVVYDSTAKTFTATLDTIVGDAKAVSAKNLSSSPTFYQNNNICSSALSVTGPILSLVDAAQMNGHNYYLSALGTIYYEDGSVIAQDLKLVSIAYDVNSRLWYLLRSDGQVMSTPTLNDPTSYAPIPGLIIPAAQSLSIGFGPPAC